MCGTEMMPRWWWCGGGIDYLFQRPSLRSVVELCGISQITPVVHCICILFLVVPPMHGVRNSLLVAKPVAGVGLMSMCETTGVLGLEVAAVTKPGSV